MRNMIRIVGQQKKRKRFVKKLNAKLAEDSESDTEAEPNVRASDAQVQLRRLKKRKKRLEAERCKGTFTS